MATGDFIAIHRRFHQLSETIADTMLSQVPPVWVGLLQPLRHKSLRQLLQQDLRRERRPVAAARSAAGGIARRALPEQVATRTLALLLQGICSHSSSPLPG